MDYLKVKKLCILKNAFEHTKVIFFKKKKRKQIKETKGEQSSISLTHFNSSEFEAVCGVAALQKQIAKQQF